MNGDHKNAVAGPSTLSPHLPPLVTHSSPPPHSATLYPDTPPLLYLPPPAPSLPPQHLTATQDLLARFNLLPAYDRYVRPFVLPGDDPAPQQAQNPQQQDGGDGAGATGGPGTGLDKGKGRAREGAGAATPADADHADAGDADDDDAPGAKGEKKKKNSYKHLIKGVPGKHSLKKDDYLTTMMLVPPKQRMRIRKFDARTQEDAFTVSLEGLKGWNVNALVLESAQAREDRKKRKELKRLAKLQIQSGGQPVTSGTSPTTAVGTPQPLSATSLVAQPQPVLASASGVNARKMSGAGTPKPSVGTPRPSSRATNATPGVAVAATPSAGPPGAGGNVNGVPRPGVPRPKSAVPRPGSTVPRPGSAVSAAKQPGAGLQQQQRVGTPTGNRPGTPMEVDAGMRGKKRERDDGLPNGGAQANVNPYNANGVANGNGYANGTPNGALPPRPGVMNAKAGTGNIRPRPIKKQRMDMQGQARDATQPVQQQPTPQGV